MTGGIYLVRDNGALVAMSEGPYDSEDVLQDLLARYPALLAGDQAAGRPQRWLLVCRESPVPDELDGSARWSVDHLFLDTDGVPTLVEVKRSSDTRIRREVVGQMLDYAANAVAFWPVEKIRAEFEATCHVRKEEPEAVLQRHLEETGWDPEAFWHQVKTNLQAGRVRMLFAADVIPPELARIVEFLNTQMDPAEVLALEVRQYVGEGARTLVPRLVGQTAEAERRKGAQYQQWDSDSFYAKLAARGQTDVDAAKKIMDWAASRALRIWWGRGKQYGSFFPMLDVRGQPHWSVSVWTYGKVEVQFEKMKTTPPFADEALRMDLLQRLRQCQLPGVDFPDNCITRRPSILLSVLADETMMSRFLQALDWYLDVVKSHHASGDG